VASDEHRLARRRFLQALGATTLGVTTAIAQRSQAGLRTPAAGKARVVVVRARKALGHGYDADRGAVRAMLQAGLCALSGEKDPGQALGRYVRPSDRVGLKINGLAGRQGATHVELVDELSLMLAKTGVEPRRQVVFDRFKRDLTASGFTAQTGGDRYLCVGNDEAGHEDELAQMPSSASRLTRVLTAAVDGVINLPMLKQHSLSGISGALKNNFGCINNPNKMHLDRCDPYIAEVNAIPAIRAKQRLVVMDALRPIVENGPSYQPGAGEVANLMLFATDLVAVDTVGHGIIEDLRRKRHLPPLAKLDIFPTHLATAGRMGLGVSDRAGIEVVELEV
jgi:uncharacterized protein (DUF362 family)